MFKQIEYYDPPAERGIRYYEAEGDETPTASDHVPNAAEFPLGERIIVEDYRVNIQVTYICRQIPNAPARHHYWSVE